MLTPADHTVPEVKEWVRETDPDGDALADLYRTETRGDGRVTLTRWLASRIEDARGVDVSTATPADDRERGDHARHPTRDQTTPHRDDDAYDPDAHPYWAPNEVPSPGDVPLVVVTPATDGSQSLAGYWFDHNEVRVVRRTRRVDAVIVAGDLDHRGPAPPNAEDGDTLR